VIVGIVFLVSGTTPTRPRPRPRAARRPRRPPARAPTPSCRPRRTRWRSRRAAGQHQDDGQHAEVFGRTRHEHRHVQDYTATVVTTTGTFDITLDAKAAPITVNNFVFLANKGYYHCVIFHRVIPSFMDQTGDPTGTGQAVPATPSRTRTRPRHHAAQQYPLGSVAMATPGKPTRGAAVLHCRRPQGESLPNTYALFGSVTSGMNVVDTSTSRARPGCAAQRDPAHHLHHHPRELGPPPWPHRPRPQPTARALSSAKFDEEPPCSSTPTAYVATMVTSHGTMVFALDALAAPGRSTASSSWPVPLLRRHRGSASFRASCSRAATHGSGSGGPGTVSPTSCRRRAVTRSARCHGQRRPTPTAASSSSSAVRTGWGCRPVRALRRDRHRLDVVEKITTWAAAPARRPSRSWIESVTIEEKD